MVMPVSVRLDDDVKDVLQQEARQRHMGLSGYLRMLAAEAAERVQRERIRKQSGAVGAFVARSEQARGFYEDWGTLLTPSSPPHRD
jgi:predicted transcriptional regulator